MRYNAVQSNSSAARRDGYSPGNTISLATFATWFATAPRHCAYCKITEDHLPLLGVLTQMGYPLSRLGVDRLDSNRGYEIDNIQLCCFACNKVKSNTFATDEMFLLGATVSQVWVIRLASQGITWSPNAAL